MRAVTGCLAAVLLVLPPAAARSAEPIQGRWRTANGETAEIASCGGSYCITVTTGRYAGSRVGEVSGSGDTYEGTITDPSNKRTYAGTAAVVGGNRLELTGCALKVFCRSQTWTRR